VVAATKGVRIQGAASKARTCGRCVPERWPPFAFAFGVAMRTILELGGVVSTQAINPGHSTPSCAHQFPLSAFRKLPYLYYAAKRAGGGVRRAVQESARW
jgi:hypothetical protein